MHIAPPPPPRPEPRTIDAATVWFHVVGVALLSLSIVGAVTWNFAALRIATGMEGYDTTGYDAGNRMALIMQWFFLLAAGVVTAATTHIVLRLGGVRRVIAITTAQAGALSWAIVTLGAFAP